LEEQQMNSIHEQATVKTRARYDHNARFYDLMESGSERRFAPWRANLWSRVRGKRVLEVGWGPGRTCLTIPKAPL
jgi:ubiquinone/menaquinone biosynthesis C-methylase UbiE